MTRTIDPVDATAAPPAVLSERRGHVLVVTINRPEARNAVNLAVAGGLGAALEEAETDADVRAVVVTGAGDLAFCAGADLKAVARGEAITFPPDAPEAAWGFAGFVQHAVSVPVIAAVNGFALGGGTEIALASDLVVAAETATFGLPEVKRGIIAAAGGAFRLAQQIPPKIALELALTGQPIQAGRALELGLVNRVVPGPDLMPTALALAEAIAANAPLAVQATKRLARSIGDGRFTTEDMAWAATDSEARGVMHSDDATEGVRAFAEKRSPNWSGS